MRLVPLLLDRFSLQKRLFFNARKLHISAVSTLCHEICGPSTITCAAFTRHAQNPFCFNLRNHAVTPFHNLRRSSTSNTPDEGNNERKGDIDPRSQENIRRILFYLAAKFISIICAIILGIYSYDCFFLEFPAINKTDFLSCVERGEVEKFYIFFDKYFVKYHDSANRQNNLLQLDESIDNFMFSVRAREQQLNIPPSQRMHVTFGIPPGYSRLPAFLENHIGSIMFLFVTTAFIDLPLIFLKKFPYAPAAGRRVQKQSKKQEDIPIRPRWFGESTKAENEFKGENPSVRFEDIAGMHACKREVMEFVAFLENPEKFDRLGAKLPRNALLLGPPGTGKTLLVKALATETNVPFFYMAGSQFIEIIGGLGAARLRKLFRRAREEAPSIIFIDELDSVGRRRSPSMSSSEMEQTLNQLLVELDGMDTLEQVIVFGATNRVDLLDPALLRAGRFDRHIYVSLPNFAERQEILDLYMKKCALDPAIAKEDLIKHLAKWTAGRSGADIANLCNEAAILAVRRDKNATAVTRADFEAALERSILGAAKRHNPLTPPERRVAAVQESGRALIAWLLAKSTMLPTKVSIVPRGESLSAQQGDLHFAQFASEMRHIYTSNEINDRIAILLGGRAAEQIVFHSVSDASQRLLRRAQRLASLQVREYGFSEVIGNMSFKGDSDPSNNMPRPYSRRTRALMEVETQRIMSTVFKRCLDLVQNNKALLEALVSALLEKEELTAEQIEDICKRASEVQPAAA